MRQGRSLRSWQGRIRQARRCSEPGLSYACGVLRSRLASPVARDSGARLEEHIGAEVDAALAELEAAQAEPYYDASVDQIARGRYYEELDASDGEPLRAALAELLERTHDPRPSYKPMQWVYPRVDLHPDGLLRSVYSGRRLPPRS